MFFSIGIFSRLGSFYIFCKIILQHPKSSKPNPRKRKIENNIKKHLTKLDPSSKIKVSRKEDSKMSHKYNRLEDYIKTLPATQRVNIVYTTENKMETLAVGFAFNLRKLEWSTNAKNLEVFATELDEKTLVVYTRIYKEEK